jgi:hypothetical protein
MLYGQLGLDLGRKNQLLIKLPYNKPLILTTAPQEQKTAISKIAAHA